MKRIKKHIIDCDSDPKIPYSEWKVEEHIKGGKLEWDASKVSLWLSPEQKDGYISGHELRKKIENPLNANVLDYLYEHQDLIPEGWKEKTKKGDTQFIYFWGTIYRNSDGNLCVRCLCWDGAEWGWDYGWLGLNWDDGSPAARCVSTQNLESKNSLEPLSLDLEKAIKVVKEGGYQVSKIM